MPYIKLNIFFVFTVSSFIVCSLGISSLGEAKVNPLTSPNITTKRSAELMFYPTYDAPATAISLNHAVISAELKGTIQSLPFQVGDTVEKDATIATLNCRDYQLNHDKIKAEINAIRAQLAFNDWQLNKVKSLAHSQNVSQERVKELQTSLTTLQSKLSSQQSELAMTEVQIDRCEVKAPFRGVVTERLIQLGEQAAPGTPLLRMIDTEAIELSAQLLPDEIESLNNAKQLLFRTSNHAFPIRLRATVPAYNMHTKSLEVRLVFNQEKPLAGTMGRLVWQDQDPFLPAQLLTQHNKQLGILIANDNKAVFMPIPKAVEGRPIPVPSTFQGEIILDGRYHVSDGDSIVQSST